MALSGKFWGGMIGMMFGGPLGAVAGVYVGHQIDSSKQSQRGLNEKSVFQINLISILAYVAKVDDDVDPREIKTILNFFRQIGFGPTQMQTIERTLHFALTQDIDLATTCQHFRKSTNYESCLMLLRVVYLVVMADNQVHKNEKAAIEQIAHYLGITDADFEMLRAEFIKTADKFYKILGLEPGVTIITVKKAYRKLALQYHPDRVAHLGQEYADVAEEKFKLINEAYEKVTKEIQSG
ncbi:TerB family tellurite resistance protein [Candidatus Omnitrophota bacterium]